MTDGNMIAGGLGQVYTPAPGGAFTRPVLAHSCVDAGRQELATARVGDSVKKRVSKERLN